MAHISILTNLHNHELSQVSTDWDTLCQFFSTPMVTDDKQSAPLFNGCSYLRPEDITDSYNIIDIDEQPHTRRHKQNLLNMDLLIVDYDNANLPIEEQLTIEKAKRQYSQFTYFAYTSHSHSLQQHRFRMAFLLSSPIPVHWHRHDNAQWANGVLEQLTPALKEFFPACDTSSFKPNQFFFVASCSPENQQHFQAWSNAGVPLDWSTFKLAEVLPAHVASTGKPNPQYHSDDAFLNPEDFLETRSGVIRVGDITTRIQNVKCPFHADNNGSEFVNVTAKGLPFLHCKRCEKTYFMKPMDAPVKEQTQADIDSALEYDNYDWIDFKSGDDRTHVEKTLQDILQKMIGRKGYEIAPFGPIPVSHIVYMPEGSGKTRLVIALAKLGYPVVFAAKSYDQLNEKYAEFQKAGQESGFDVEIIKSTGGVIQSIYGVKPVRNSSPNPFKLSGIKEEETVAAILQNNPEENEQMIRLRLAFSGASRFEFPRGDNKTKIILLTFTMLRMLSTLHITVPKSWTIWIDDPDYSDLMDIAPVAETANTIELTQTSHTDGGSKKLYYFRDPAMWMGKPYKYHRQVVTTTERVTLKFTQQMFGHRKEAYQLHDDMHGISGGSITLLGTEKVRMNMDGLLPIVIRHLSNKLGKNLEFIADGLSLKYNHSNTKGKNTLTDVDTIIKVSIPHPSSIRTICDALHGADFEKDSHELCRDVMQDKLHQALGRNKGYRNHNPNSQAVALIDPNYHKIILENCRYSHSRSASKIIDRTKSMSRNDTRTGCEPTTLVGAIEYSLNNPDDLFLDNRKVKPAIQHVYTAIATDAQKVDYTFRLLLALGTTGNFTYLSEKAPEPTSRQGKYHNLGLWVLDQFTDTASRDKVMKKYRQHFKNKVESIERQKKKHYQ